GSSNCSGNTRLISSPACAQRSSQPRSHSRSTIATGTRSPCGTPSAKCWVSTSSTSCSSSEYGMVWRSSRRSLATNATSRSDTFCAGSTSVTSALPSIGSDAASCIEPCLHAEADGRLSPSLPCQCSRLSLAQRNTVGFNSSVPSSVPSSSNHSSPTAGYYRPRVSSNCFSTLA